MTEDDAIDAKLKDVPDRVRFFLESSIDVIKTLSLLYAGTPDERAHPHLEGYLSRVEPGLIEAMGAGNASIMLDTLRGAIMGRKTRNRGRSSVDSMAEPVPMITIPIRVKRHTIDQLKSEARRRCVRSRLSWRRRSLGTSLPDNLFLAVLDR